MPFNTRPFENTIADSIRRVAPAAYSLEPGTTFLYHHGGTVEILYFLGVVNRWETPSLQRKGIRAAVLSPSAPATRVHAGRATHLVLVEPASDDEYMAFRPDDPSHERHDAIRAAEILVMAPSGRLCRAPETQRDLYADY